MDIMKGRRSITADTVVRLGLHFGNSAPFWIALQSQYAVGRFDRKRGAEVARQVWPADTA